MNILTMPAYKKYEILKKYLNKILTPKEREVLELRFYAGYSLKDCATYFKFSKQRASQIEIKALDKLKDSEYPEMKKLLKNFIEIDPDLFRTEDKM